MLSEAEHVVWLDMRKALMSIFMIEIKNSKKI